MSSGLFQPKHAQTLQEPLKPSRHAPPLEPVAPKRRLENAKALPLAQAHIRLGVQDEPGPRGVPILPVREGDELQERQEAFLHHLEPPKQKPTD